MKIPFFISCSVLLMFCKSNTSVNSKCKLNRETIDYKNMAITESFKNIDDSIVTIIEYSKDSSLKVIYDFYDLGELKGFRFFINRNTYTYLEAYKRNGDIDTILGTPLAKVYSVKKDSTISLTYFLFNLNKQFNSVKISTKNGIFFQPEIYENSLFSNISTISIELPINLKDEVYFECKMMNVCLNKESQVLDTFFVQAGLSHK